MRVMQTFWLDLSLEVERELDQAIARLKAKRQFAPTLRNGLRLIISLRETENLLVNGEQPAFNALSLIEVMFPKVVQYIASRYHSTELESLRREMVELKQRLDTAATLPAAPKQPVPVAAVEVKKAKKKTDNFANLMKTFGGFSKT